MSNHATKMEHEHQVSVYVNVETDKLMEIGKEMETINEDAYMNGYNWEAFLNHFLQINHPELLEGLDTDSEAGTYVALYDNVDSEKADKLTAIINNLINEPEKIYAFLNENGEDIEWD
ncbi:MAG: hypothetical protein EOO44_19440 [Flavobacterium sp.]|nr:MAG: hypothetical protein EOO44_19440 [Flavobacterium sp.]